MRKSLAVLLVLLLGITLVIALAGDKDKKSSEKPGEMPMGMPPMPTAELAKLDVFVGTWNGDETLNFPGMPPGSKSKSTKVTKKALNGMCIMGSYKSSWGEGDKKTNFEGLSIWTYDPMQKTYREWWFDSMAPGGQESQGKWVDDKTYVSEYSGENMGQPYKGRFTTVVVSSSKYTTKIEMDNGQGWYTMMSGTYTKQGEVKKASK